MTAFICSGSEGTSTVVIQSPRSATAAWKPSCLGLSCASAGCDFHRLAGFSRRQGYRSPAPTRRIRIHELAAKARVLRIARALRCRVRTREQTVRRMSVRRLRTGFARLPLSWPGYKIEASASTELWGGVLPERSDVGPLDKPDGQQVSINISGAS